MMALQDVMDELVDALKLDAEEFEEIVLAVCTSESLYGENKEPRLCYDEYLSEQKFAEVHKARAFLDAVRIMLGTGELSMPASIKVARICGHNLRCGGYKDLDWCRHELDALYPADYKATEEVKHIMSFIQSICERSRLRLAIQGDIYAGFSVEVEVLEKGEGYLDRFDLTVMNFVLGCISASYDINRVVCRQNIKEYVSKRGKLGCRGIQLAIPKGIFGDWLVDNLLDYTVRVKKRENFGYLLSQVINNSPLG